MRVQGIFKDRRSVKIDRKVREKVLDKCANKLKVIHASDLDFAVYTGIRAVNVVLASDQQDDYR